jgi:hypothetical protein
LVFFFLFFSFLPSSLTSFSPSFLLSFSLSLSLFYLFIFAVPGLELRAYTLSHSTSPTFVKGFTRYGLAELFVLAGFKPTSS